MIEAEDKPGWITGGGAGGMAVFAEVLGRRALGGRLAGGMRRVEILLRESAA